MVPTRHLAGHLLDRIPIKHVAVAGLLLATLGEGSAALVDQRTALAAGLAVASMGIGAVFVTAFRSALASAGPEEGGVRSAVVSTAHELGGAVGVALLSTLAASALAAVHPASGGFCTAYGTAAGIALAAAAIAAVLVPAVRLQHTTATTTERRTNHQHRRRHAHVRSSHLPHHPPSRARGPRAPAPAPTEPPNERQMVDAAEPYDVRRAATD